MPLPRNEPRTRDEELALQGVSHEALKASREIAAAGRRKKEREEAGAPEATGPEDFNIRRDVIWAYQHLGARGEEDPPSTGALALLRWARLNERAFFETFLPKVFLSKGELEQAERQSDDGRAILELIERVRGASPNSLVPDGAEGDAGEPALP